MPGGGPVIYDLCDGIPRIMNFKKIFITFAAGIVLISNILNLTHIFSNDNSHDYSISVSSDDEIDELSK